MPVADSFPKKGDSSLAHGPSPRGGLCFRSWGSLAEDRRHVLPEQEFEDLADAVLRELRSSREREPQRSATPSGKRAALRTTGIQERLVESPGGAGPRTIRRQQLIRSEEQSLPPRREVHPDRRDARRDGNPPPDMPCLPFPPSLSRESVQLAASITISTGECRSCRGNESSSVQLAASAVMPSSNSPILRNF
jgi:hypothetical protein